MPRHRVRIAMPACPNQSGKIPHVATCFAVVGVGCSVVFFAVFSKVIEVVLIYSKYHLQICLKLPIRTSESREVVCFVGNRHCQFVPARQFVPATMPSCDLSTQLLFTEYSSSLCVLSESTPNGHFP